jgi:hypothetical protein
VRRFLLAATFWIAITGTAHASERTIEGRVLDEAGEGVAGVRVATSWTSTAEGLRPLGGVQTGPDGSFSLPCACGAEPVPVVAFHADGTRGALGMLKAAPWGREHEMRLERLVTLEGKVLLKGGEAYPAGWSAWLVPQGGPPVLRVERAASTLSARVPPGRYDLVVQAPGQASATRTLPVLPAGSAHALGTIELADSEARVPKGMVAPPMRYAEASDELVAALATRHFPDRWTLCYFWAHR